MGNLIAIFLNLIQGVIIIIMLAIIFGGLFIAGSGWNIDRKDRAARNRRYRELNRENR